MTEKTHYEKVSGSQNEKEKLATPIEYGYGVRHVQAFLLFMSLSLGYISRGHIGVTIVAMTNEPTKGINITANDNNITDLHIEITLKNETDYDKGLQSLLQEIHNNSVHSEMGGAVRDRNDTLENNESFVNEDSESSIWNIYGTYNWPKSTQELVLGAFFLGYFIMMFPTGLVVQRWGGKLPLQIALFVNGVVPMAVPWLTAWGGWKVLCVCRFVQGLSQAGMFPAIHTLIANWVPVSERATLNSYVYTGPGFGTIVAFQLAGVLGDSRWGWASTFWVTGLMCFLGFLFLTFFGANKPADHKSVSEREKNYIMGHFGDEKIISKTPWRNILTSKHAWACFSGNIGSGVTFVFFLTEIPTYMHSILHFNIRSVFHHMSKGLRVLLWHVTLGASGLLSSLPYISTLLATIAFGHLSDVCTNRKIFSINSARKIANTIGGVGSAVCIAGVVFTQNSTLAVILFTTMLSLHGAGHSGWMENPHQWRVVFLLIACLSFTANAFYVLFMSVEAQSWNDTEPNAPEEVKLKRKPSLSDEPKV